MKKIYDCSPPFIKNILLSVYYLSKYNQRYGKEYKKYLKFLEKAQYWSNDQLQRYQNKRLKKFLIFAYENTKYYKDIFDKSGFNPYKFRDKSEISRLPSLDKNIIKDNYNNILPMNWLENKKSVNVKTSGTTGSPLQFPKTIKTLQMEYAVKDFISEIFTGRKLKDIKSVYIAGHKIKNINKDKPPFWAYNILTRSKYFSSYHLKKSNFKYYIKELVKFSPDIILGYPSSINLLAEYMNARRFSLDVSYVWTASESLLDYQRENIQNAFGCEINNVYGNAEGIGRSFTCPEGNQHLLQFDNIVSFEDNIYLTNFENYAFPLIRYKITDNLVLSNKKECKCGRNGILLQRIEGRVEDYIITSDNRKIGRLDHIFKDLNNIIEAQIYQKEVGKAIFRIVTTKFFSDEDKKKLLSNIRGWLGNDFNPELIFLDRIPRTDNGKFRFVISDVDEDILNNA